MGELVRRRRRRPRPSCETILSDPSNNPAARPVRVWDIPLVWFAPRRLFARVEDVPAYGWPLTILLTCVTLIGYASVQTGLIDRLVTVRVQQNIESIDRERRDVVERSELRDLYEQAQRQGQFERVIERMRVIVAQPVSTLATALLIAAVLYGMVALTGRKAEWNTLLTICVFAGFIELLRLVARLALMLHYGVLDVYTSPAPLVRALAGADADGSAVALAYGLLSAADPFCVWYWLVVLIGLSATAQLPGWRAWLACGLLWLVGAAARTGMDVALVSAGPPAT